MHARTCCVCVHAYLLASPGRAPHSRSRIARAGPAVPTGCARACLQGPPGTGKTTSARIIATQAAVPLVYIPLEAVVSKWYGESERTLAGEWADA